MALPLELVPPFNIPSGDILYKIGDEDEWTRLQSPANNRRHNCYGIRFDSGVTLTQKFYDHGSICHLHLILKPPVFGWEDGEPTIEAACVKIGNATFSAHHECRHEDVATALERAKTLPLALLDQRVQTVKLRHLSRRGGVGYDFTRLAERICALLDRGYRKWCDEVTTESRPRQTEKLWTILPRPSSGGASETCADGHKRKEDQHEPEERLQAHRAETTDGELLEEDKHRLEEDKRKLGEDMHKLKEDEQRLEEDKHKLKEDQHKLKEDKDKLKERLQAHQAETTDGELRLRQGLEEDKQGMLRAVIEAINGEWDKKVAAAVAEYRARAASTMENMVGEGEV